MLKRLLLDVAPPSWRHQPAPRLRDWRYAESRRAAGQALPYTVFVILLAVSPAWAQTAGCGAGTDQSQCGNVGNPYASYPGGTQPTANATLSACGALSAPSAGYVYRLTSNIGSDPTTSCITWYYGYPFVLDLNGHTVTGTITGQINPYGIVIMAGTVNCTSSSTGCIDIQQGWAGPPYDQIHHLTLNQAALGGRCINFNQQNTGTYVSTPYLQIYNVQGTLPNSIEGGGARSYLIWVGGLGLIAAEAWNNTFSPGANLNDFEGITMYKTIGSYVHNNYIVLPHPAYDLGTYDTDRAILFDCEADTGSACSQGGSNVAAYNQIVADENRSIRIRAESGDVLHDNVILDCRMASGQACIHIGDPDIYTEPTSASVYNNTIEINDGNAIGVIGSGYQTADVYNNTVTCYSGSCASAGWFAFTEEEEPSFPESIAAGTLTVSNNTFPSGWASRNAVLSCGPAGNPSYTCLDTSGTDYATVIYCNTGTVVGNGTITESCGSAPAAPTGLTAVPH